MLPFPTPLRLPLGRGIGRLALRGENPGACLTSGDILLKFCRVLKTPLNCHNREGLTWPTGSF